MGTCPLLLYRGDPRDSSCTVSQRVSLHVRLLDLHLWGEERFWAWLPNALSDQPRGAATLRLVPEHLQEYSYRSLCSSVLATSSLPHRDVKVGRSKVWTTQPVLLQSGGCTMDTRGIAWVFCLLFNIYLCE